MKTGLMVEAAEDALAAMHSEQCGFVSSPPISVQFLQIQLHVRSLLPLVCAYFWRRTLPVASEGLLNCLSGLCERHKDRGFALRDFRALWPAGALIRRAPNCARLACSGARVGPHRCPILRSILRVSEQRPCGAQKPPLQDSPS